MNAADVIRGALELLGPNGENWSRFARNGECILSALKLKNSQSIAQNLIADEITPLYDYAGITVLRFNDDPHTTWEDVRLVLKRALHRAESEGL